MNPDTTPTPRPMPRTEAVVNKSIKQDDGEYLTEDLHMLSRQLERELAEKNNEVARLRELLERAIEIADNYEIAGLPRDGFMLHWKVNKHEFSMLKEKTRLAPAPEEPVIQENRITEPDPEKPTIAKSATVEPAPEWRELLPHEKVQKGDEEWWHKELGWRPATSSIGEKAGETLYLTRTRRALQKQEEMPLEGEIASIEWSCAHTARAIRYLRDQIQKLKEIK